MSEIDWTAWHRDGHRLDAAVIARRVAIGIQAGQLTFELKVWAECPDDSVCHQHFASPDADEYRCLVQDDIAATFYIDFIEFGDVRVPEGWSSGFPIEFEWQDQGEDGIRWRPVVAE